MEHRVDVNGTQGRCQYYHWVFTVYRVWGQDDDSTLHSYGEFVDVV